jgi:TadE-like protein
LVEFCLVMPIFLFAGLGMIEAGFLFAHQHGYQSGADVLAAWSAAHEADAPGGSGFSEGAPGAPWQLVVASEASRTGCDGSPAVSWLDGRLPGDRVRVDVTCHFTPQATSNIWPGGLDVSVQAEAVIPGAVPSPSPTP